MARCLAILACAVSLVSGCAVTPHRLEIDRSTDPTARDDWRDTSEAYLTLLRLAEETAAPIDLGPLRLSGFDRSRLDPVASLDAESRARAGASLGETLSELASRLDPPQAAPQTRQPPTPSQMGAQRLYASGMLRSLDGLLAEAAGDFAAAAALDRASTAPLLKLAEAQGAMGQGAAALESYRQAIDRGSRDPLALAVLGLQAAQQGASDESAMYLAACMLERPSRADPLLDNVALIALATQLRELGYLNASIGAAVDGLRIPTRIVRPTRFADEASRITVRAADLLRESAIDAIALGELDRADALLDRASRQPGASRDAIAALRVASSLRRGQAAAGAIVVIDHMHAHRGLAGPRLLRAIDALGAAPATAGLLLKSLEDLEDSAEVPSSASVRSTLTLAKASLLDDASAVALLQAHAADSPDDFRAIGDLVRRLPDPRACVATGLRLTEQSPASAAMIAERLVNRIGAIEPILAGLPDSPAARLLETNVRMQFHQAAEPIASARAGLDVLSTSNDVELRNALALALGTAAATAGDQAALGDAVAAAAPGPEGALTRASIYRLAQHFDQSAAEVDGLGPVGLSVEETLRLAEVHLSAGRPADAERWLLRARELDPFEERAFEGLVALYQSGSTLANAPRLNETLAALRQEVPASSLLRWLQGQSLLQSGRTAEAERALAALAEDSTRPTGAMGLLLRIWEGYAATERVSSLEQAEAWIQALVAADPNRTELVAAHGTLLSLLGRHGEAERVLEEAFAARRSPALGRALEAAVARAGDLERTNVLAERRLRSSPGGIDTSIELAEMLLRTGRSREAITVLRRASPEDASLTSSQAERVGRALAQLIAATQSPSDAVPPQEVLGLLERLIETGVPLSWQLLDSAWRLAATESGVGDEEVARWVDRLAESVPSVEVARFLVARFPWAEQVEADSLASARAKLVYAIAGALGAEERLDASVRLLRTTLRLDPEHAGAANDLGYTLLTQGGDIAEADRLISTAYRLRPDDANITDSLGWLRYLRGTLADSATESGETVDGALTLLARAIELPEGIDSPTIHDHLADALWRSKNEEKALSIWRRAAELAEARASEFEAAGQAVPDRVADELASIRAKIAAASEGSTPAIAPLLGE